MLLVAFLSCSTYSRGSGRTGWRHGSLGGQVPVARVTQSLVMFGGCDGHDLSTVKCISKHLLVSWTRDEIG